VYRAWYNKYRQGEFLPIPARRRQGIWRNCRLCYVLGFSLVAALRWWELGGVDHHQAGKERRRFLSFPVSLLYG